jgi:pimeloyl-ACP methyl ester carboxylesterase
MPAEGLALDVTRASTRLIMLPGLGANARMFEPQRAAFPELVVPEWIRPRPGESLREYALRWAEALPREKPFVLCGVSCGSMLAQEMAGTLRPAAMVLISTCASPRQVGVWNRAAGRVLALTPRWMGEHMRTIGAVMGWPALGPLGAGERRVILEMAREAPVDVVLWGMRAILDWRGAPVPACRTLRIHGRRDRIIPALGVTADHVVEGAGHLVNMTHAAEVNTLIERFVDSLAPA